MMHIYPDPLPGSSKQLAITMLGNTHEHPASPDITGIVKYRGESGA